jgi:hypothetical protein
MNINDLEPSGWACDVPVSMPEPISAAEVLIDMGSHAFTENGLFHNLTQADLHEIKPTWAPPQAST